MRPRPTPVLALLALSPIARADVRLPAVIGHHMVLQRDMPAPLWGWADPGEEITVTIGKQHLVTKADGNGIWKVDLAPMRAGGPFELAFRGKNRITLRDVLVGEVWLCSGQSNMEWRVRQARDAPREVAAAKFPKIRLFKVPHTVSETPRSDTEAAWSHCTPQTVREFSAVGYYFGRELHRHLHEGLHRVPIGLIQSAWGGTPVEAWTSLDTLERLEAAEPVLARWNEIVARYPAARDRHRAQVAAWREAAAKAKQNGDRAPRRPRGPRGPKHPHRPANLYRGMIAPIRPYGIRGAIWYQGESNASRAYQYRSLFPALIRDWRESWDQGDFPFLFVQLANFTVRRGQDHKTWAELREAQAMALSLPHTGMAVTIDIGNPRDIHPKNKQEVGRRLALVARAKIFGQDIEFSGPRFDSMRVESNAVIARFKHCAGGLVKKGDIVTGFEIAGQDRKFHRAQATLRGDEVVVRADVVESPVAVRYAWHDNPTCNLCNKQGLPACPFRTDDWPGVTADKK